MFALASLLIAGVNLYALGLAYGAARRLAALVASYTFLGGLSAAIYNEVLQFFVILALPILNGYSGLGGEDHRRAGGPEQLWCRSRRSPTFFSVFGIVFGLGFVLSFGYWTTNFAEVQRALSAKNMNACWMTPIMGRSPRRWSSSSRAWSPRRASRKLGHPQGGWRRPRHPAHHAVRPPPRQSRRTASPALAIAGLLAAFMAGMAANVSSFNTVFTYDIWQDAIRAGGGPLLPQRRPAVTIGGCVIAIFTAYLAGSFSNLMDYIQALASFFNAPLFAIFIFGLFYKKMTGTAGWTALLSRGHRGVRRPAGARRHHRRLVAGGQLQRGQRGVHRRLPRRLRRVGTPGKTDEELSGLTGRPRPGSSAARERSRLRTPAGTGTRRSWEGPALALTLVLYIILGGERDVTQQAPHKPPLSAILLDLSGDRAHPITERRSNSEAEQGRLRRRGSRASG